MFIKSLAFAVGLFVAPAFADECRFVGVDDPAFSITFETGSRPVVNYGGEIARYESHGNGTGVSAMTAYMPDGPDHMSRTFATHEYGGEMFLVWGSDLLVERCD